MAQAGYHGTILWIDLTTSTSRLEHRDELFFRRFAGGGLAATELLLEATPAGIDPLGPENLLIFAGSVVSGQPGPGLARFTTAAKSPLSGGIGETRTEGPFAAALKGSGSDIVVFTGCADRLTVVEIRDGGAFFHPADHLAGKTTGATVDSLEERFGAGIHTAVIGEAGERLVRFASVVTDRSFQASRMGMGAVMGSKRLKAIVVPPAQLPAVADPQALETIRLRFASEIAGNSLSTWQLEPPGFSCWIYLHGLDASLCVENYRKSEFAGLDGFRKERFLEHAVTDLPCPGCPNHCMKSIVPAGSVSSDAKIDPRSCGIHQEISGSIGPNLGIDDLDVVLEANRRCNQYGLDPTSLGFTLSFAAECFDRGILTASDFGGRRYSFGDGAGTLELIDAIASRSGLGDLLAEGSKRAAARIGGDAPSLAMQVKGIELVPFEPRSQTNLALGYGVAPIGPRYDICEHDWDFDTKVGWDHTLRYSRTIGILERIPMEYLGAKKVRNYKALATLWSGADALDLCIFAVAPTRILSLPSMASLVAAVTGWETSSWEIMRFGERRLHLMRLYNLREGLSAADDELPDRFYTEPIEGGPQKGAVLDRTRYHDALLTYYRMMGWDDGGVPRLETLLDSGLAPIA
jgi:aldehyde:ferredoxin oxidoreductase